MEVAALAQAGRRSDGAALSPFGSRRVVGGGVRRAALRLFESRSECGKEAGGLAASYDTMIKSQG